MTVRRRATSAVVRWRAVRGASAYVVAGRLRGRPALKLLVDGRSLRLGGLARRTTGRLTVRALSASGEAGRSAGVKVKRARR